MPFRTTFDCLWCGRPWHVRGDDDLEGWTGLCPECLGRADDNGFLRSRLRVGLRERSAAAGGAPVRAEVAAEAGAVSPGGTPVPSVAAPRGDWEDWYLRRGGYSRGPVHDGPWTMELDEATRWLDGVAIEGTIVELGAGMGWWSGLLAEKGELWVYDTDPGSLDAARRRLMAHGLLAHLHERDPLAPPDRTVDVVFAAYFLGGAESHAGLETRMAAAAAWLRPGGSFVFVEAGPTDDGAPLFGPTGRLWPRSPHQLQEQLTAAGFDPVEVRRTRTAFVLGRAVRVASG